MKILKVKPVSYSWKRDKSYKEIGVVAQDLLENELPLLVKTMKSDQFDDGMVHSVCYDRLAVYLLKIVQLQGQRIDEFEKRMSELK